MEDAYIIKGGRPLKGKVTLSGAKNVALKIIIASLMFDTPVTLDNIPRIKDIEELVTLLQSLSVAVSFVGSSRLKIDPATLASHKVDLLHGSKTRVSFMLFAPLLYRFGRAEIPNPGGCRIGARPIDRHINMMRAFGVKVRYNSRTGYYEASLSGRPVGRRFRFGKQTHTGTELAIIFAAVSKGQTVIENAAEEPEIDDLINFFKKAGVSIVRTGTTITISGVDKLQDGAKPYEIANDRNEAITYAVFALATRGDIKVQGIEKGEIKYFIDAVLKSGGGVEPHGKSIRFYYKSPLKAQDIVTAVHPGFMTDWQAPWAILMTQADGESTIHEAVFDNRFSYVEELRKLGANIEFYKPNVKNPKKFYHFNMQDKASGENREQAIKVHGPTMLHNGVLQVSDLRAGASLLIAAATAPGESVVADASVIDRGYEKIDVKLRALGLNIKKV